MREKLTVQCTDWRPLHRNTLRGFCVVRVCELRLTIRDIAVHQHPSGARWASLPSRPVVDRNGIAKRGPNGKVEYTVLLAFEDRATRDAFSRAVIDAVLAAHPDAFAEQMEAVS